MKAKIIACSTMEAEIKKNLPPDIELELLPYALHNTPEQLQSELQQRIDADFEHDTLLFGYGLCSYGVANLRTERHTLVIPKVHDCISLLLGSRKIYDEEFAACPGTFFLSKGWVDQKGDPFHSYLGYREKYGEENARWLIDSQYEHYKRVVFIYTGVGEKKVYPTYAKQVADFLKVNYEERQGSLRILQKLVTRQWDEEFVITPPGRIVLQTDFI